MNARLSTAALQLTVDRTAARQRLDCFLAGQATWGTRSQVQRLIAAGLVRIDGRVAKASALLRSGQQIEVEPMPVAGTATVEPEAIALDVLYEDDCLLIVNKPPGLVVHPAPGNWRGTLVAALLHRWQGRPSDLDPLRPGIVHRLDKDTSGVLLIAKDQSTLTELGRQFRSREVAKEYLALVWGTLSSRRGEIRQPIGRHPVHRKRMSVRRGGREAVTRYEVVASTQAVSLVRIYPETGRTHQIRVHLAAVGHPIVGDRLYGRGRSSPVKPAVRRQALHAATLTVRHPRGGELLRISAPIPADLTELFATFGLRRLTSRNASSSVLKQRVRGPSGTEHQAFPGPACSSHHISPTPRPFGEERT